LAIFTYRIYEEVGREEKKRKRKLLIIIVALRSSSFCQINQCNRRYSGSEYRECWLYV